MPRATRAAAGAVVLLLVLDGLAAVQIQRSRRPPSFDRGGRFRRAQVAEAPATNVATTVATDLATPAPPPTATTAPVAPSTTVRPAAPTTTATAALGVALARPATGTYVYAVEGSESASGFGGRSLEPRTAVVAHRGAGAGPDETVFDYEYSRDHEEREILAYRPDGVFLTYEGGSLTFGPLTETSATALDPPPALAPAPLAAGTTARGTTTARAGDGSPVRVEDWTARVVRRERVATGLGPVDAWVVAFERNSRPGTRERLNQTLTWWYDAGRAVPVKWEESLRAERDRAVTLRYELHAVAILSAVRPG